MALLWGPSAGYENRKRFNSRWAVTPVRGQGLGGQMSVAVRGSKPALAAGIDKALRELQPEIQALADKYGFPGGEPVPLAAAARVQPAPKEQRLAQALTVHGGWVATAGPAPSAASPQAAGPAPDVTSGRTRFNDVCSHCHGANGASPISERDLRRLKRRYKENWRETAITTINNGRVDLGMPAWKAVYTEQQIDEILDFLATIQKK